MSGYTARRVQLTAVCDLGAVPRAYSPSRFRDGIGARRRLLACGPGAVTRGLRPGRVAERSPIEAVR
jgi:hypothetical protein